MKIIPKPEVQTGLVKRKKQEQNQRIENGIAIFQWFDQQQGIVFCVDMLVHSYLPWRHIFP